MLICGCALSMVIKYETNLVSALYSYLLNDKKIQTS